MKKQSKQTNLVEKLCQFLGRNNFASEFLDYVSSWLFPLPTAFANSSFGAMPMPKFRKNEKDIILEMQKPIMMARPPSGTENFRGAAPTKPHEAHDQPAPAAPNINPMISWIPIIGPILHYGIKKAAEHASVPCSDPLYRGMHGAPCKFEGGSDNKCPKGTVSGWWWSYEVPGKGRIYYVDCCGGNPTHTVFCNWSAEPNWCMGLGKAAAQGIYEYNCTLAILEADLNVKAVGSGYEVVGVDP
jgi:hypothetical protein